MIHALIDWFDLRLGVRDIYERHIKYPLPEDVSFWNLFGGLTIACILIQFVTGFYMIFYYIPEPDIAHESIKAMANNTTYGALMRNSHRYSATLGMLFLLIHAGHVVARRAYKYPRELNWWTGMAIGFIFFLLLISGVIMPWDWRSYWELVIWTDWVGTIPVFGSYLKGPMLSLFSLGENFAMHIMLLPLLIVALVAVHIVLFRRLGMSDKV